VDRMRISWPAAARLGAVALAAVLAIALLPGLLRAPDPPPLDPGIGLVAPAADIAAAGRDERHRDPVDPVAFERAERSPTTPRERDEEPGGSDRPPRASAPPVPVVAPSPPAAAPAPAPPAPAPSPAPVPAPTAPAPPTSEPPTPEPPAGYQEFGP